MCQDDKYKMDEQKIILPIVQLSSSVIAQGLEH